MIFKKGNFFRIDLISSSEISRPSISKKVKSFNPYNGFKVCTFVFPICKSTSFLDSTSGSRLEIEVFLISKCLSSGNCF